MNRFILILLSILYAISAPAQSFGRKPLDEVEKKSVDEQVVESPQSTFAIEGEIDPNTYILGPGDEIGINILTAENVTLNLRITPTGDLFIPSVGVVHVSGMNLSEAIEIVSEFVRIQAYPSAKVNLVLVNLRMFKIQIIGAVNEPGFVIVNPLDRLSDAISLSGDFHQLAQEFNIEIKRKNGVALKVNYLDYLRTGELENNPDFQEGDKIIVPFGRMDKEGIVLRGAVIGSGYDIIEPNEILGNFLQRRVKFNDNADLESVVVTRPVKGEMTYFKIAPGDLYSTELNAGETIDILWEKGVMVNGFVLTPGGFDFFPGYTAADYISMAGGNSFRGNPNNCTVRHRDGSTERGQGVPVRRGDVIVVPRTLKDSIIGETSLLQIVVSMVTIYLAYAAIGA